MPGEPHDPPDQDVTQSLAPVRDPFPPGRLVSHYEIIRKLGEGGMGVVYEALDRNLGRRAALKLISNAGATPDSKARFAREARAASTLNHPNIVTIYEYGSEDSLDFIAMEYLEGVSLSAVLKQRQTPLPTLLSYARQIASALAKAHAHGIVHRDLKPGNVIVTPDGAAKVLDFGLAKYESHGDETLTAPLTQVGAVLGTPAYMSPEQAMGEPADARADVFAFGVILYEMVCGKRPFHGASTLETLRQIVNREPDPVTTVNPAADPDLAAAIHRCLAKDKDARFPSMAEVLELFPADTPSLSRWSVQSVAPAPPAAPSRTHRYLLAAAAIALLAVLSFAAKPFLFPVTPNLQTPQSAQDWFALGKSHLARIDVKGNDEKAIEAFRKSLDLDPSNAAAHAALSQALTGKVAADPQIFRHALEAANQAIEKNPLLAAGHSAKAGALIALGRHPEALPPVETALRLDPQSPLALIHRAAIHEKSAQPADAETLLHKAASLAPNDWYPAARLGQFLYAAGRYPDAVAAFESALARSPGNAIVLRNLGGAYHQVGRDEDAASAFQRALESAPSAQGFSNLGTLLFYLGRYADSARAFEQAIAINATSHIRWGNLADAYRWTPGNRPKSLDAYRRASQLAREALARTPNDDNVRSSLALYLAKSGQAPDALALLDALAPASLSKPAILFKSAIVRELAGQRRPALALLEKALAAGYPAKELETEPELTTLRNDPAFHLLLARQPKK